MVDGWDELDEDDRDEDDLDEDDAVLGLDERGADVGRAPICGSCGVTTLPADPANVIDTAFFCDNEDCLAYGEVIG